MKREDAEEYTQALGQVVAGGWRQIALGQRLGVPKALGLETNDWVKQRLGGYVKYSLEERQEAVKALAAEGLGERKIAGAVGVDRETVRKDLGKRRTSRKPTTTKDKDADDRASDGGKPTTDPLDTVTGLFASNAVRDQVEADTRKAQRDDEREAQRTAAAAAAKAAPPADVDATIQHKDCTAMAAEMAAGSVQLVFTDPPYHDKTLSVYADLGKVAATLLKDGGSLITYTSHHRMPEVIAMLQQAGLTFFWPLAMRHTGAKARMTEYAIVVHWKPLLWFVKGTFRSRDDMRFVNDLVESAPEKDAHPWQQGTIEARYYIEALTEIDDLVFDPFCGGGPTAVAAAQTLRRWVSCDIDEKSVWIARQRVREAVAAVQS